MVHSLVGEGNPLLFFVQLIVPMFFENGSLAVEACKWVGFIVITGIRILLTLSE